MTKLLLIEDDSLVSRMYQKALTALDFEVTLANNGQEGLDLVEPTMPNVIVCDIMMPELNGIQVLEKIKQNPKVAHIPMIMLTNLSGTHDAQTAVTKGAAAYLVKSEYKPKEIAQKIQEVIAQANQPATPVSNPNPATPTLDTQSSPTPTPANPQPSASTNPPATPPPQPQTQPPTQPPTQPQTQPQTTQTN